MSGTGFARGWQAGERFGAKRDAGATGRAPLTAGERELVLQRLELVARTMDAAFVIPGTNVKLGIDVALGLVPVVGDMIAGAIAAYIVLEARRLGAPPLLLARMAANVLVDTVAGSVPGLGDAFDVAFKANMRNVALLRRWLEFESGTVIDGETVRR